MAENRGKKFEGIIKDAFLKVPDTSVVRLHDQTMGYSGGSNHCDFIVYKKPYVYHIECKSTHKSTLSIHSNPKPDKNGILHGFHGMITDTQWDGLLESSKVPGVIAGIICWWIEDDITRFIPITLLEHLYSKGVKSIRYDCAGAMMSKYDNAFDYDTFRIPGKKKRVFFDYDMNEFFNYVEKCL